MVIAESSETLKEYIGEKNSRGFLGRLHFVVISFHLMKHLETLYGATWLPVETKMLLALHQVYTKRKLSLVVVTGKFTHDLSKVDQKVKG